MSDGSIVISSFFPDIDDLYLLFLCQSYQNFINFFLISENQFFVLLIFPIIFVLFSILLVYAIIFISFSLVWVYFAVLFLHS